MGEGELTAQRRRGIGIQAMRADARLQDRMSARPQDCMTARLQDNENRTIELRIII